MPNSINHALQEVNLQNRISNRLLSFVACIVLYAWSFSSHAVRVDNLYEAMVPVVSQDSALRAAALRGVLRAVAVKVSGQSTLPAYFSSASVPVQHLVEQFGYESVEKPNGRRALQFWARLSATGVQQVLRDQGLPVWPEERPATLIWLALHDSQGQRIMAADDDHAVISAIQALADSRGLPVVLPLMDLSERAGVDFSRVAAMSPDQLRAVSEKYASQYMLVGHIQQTSGKLWRARWLLADSNTPVVTPTGTLEDVVAAAINPLTSQIARQFASFSRSDNPQYIDLTVDDVQGAEDYARVLNYLKSLSLINEVDVVRLDQDGVHVRIHSRADVAAVLQVIQIGRMLYPRDVADGFVYGLNP